MGRGILGATHSPGTRRREWLLGLALVAIVAWIYMPVFTAGYIWDDDEYVTENENLHDLGGLARIWLAPRSSPQYYPLVFTTFWIERQAFGAASTPHHAVNVLLHAANALILWAVLRRLQVRASYLIALVFAVHPVHVESVAWITERKNVLSGFFYLAAVRVYFPCLFAAPPPRSASAGGHAEVGCRAGYVSSLLLFVCALLAKTVTATLPAVLLLLGWWKHGRITRGDLLRVAPFVALGLLASLGTVWLEVQHVGAAGTEWALDPLQRIVLAGRVCWFYTWKLVWPHPLIFIYPRWQIALSALQVLYPLGAAACLALLYTARERLGREPFVAAAFFVLTLAPAMGFVNVYPMRFSYVADHFQYLASIGVIALLIGTGAWLAERVRLAPVRLVVGGCLVLALSVTARAETRKYEGAEALWLDTIASNPDAWIAQNNLGNLRLQQRRWDEARAHFEEALRVKPDLAEAHNNLGTALYSQRQREAAVREYRAAVGLNPQYAEAWNNLGTALSAEERYADAIKAFEVALAAKPNYATAHYNLGNVFLRMNDLDRANQHYMKALSANPDLAMAHYNLGLNLLTQGETEKARPHLTRAFALAGDFAVGHLQVGNTQLRLGLTADAIASYTAAITIKPDYAEAFCNRGTARLQRGQVQEAILDYTEALRLRPGYTNASAGLARARKLSSR